MFIKTVLIAIFVTLFCHLSHEKAVGGPDYSGCKTDYQCFGLPSKCVDDKSCQVLLKTKALEDGNVDFELSWARPSTSPDSWVSAALSTDGKMGDDLTTLFIVGSDNSVKDMEGLTFVDHAAKTAGVKAVQVSGISIKSEKIENGLLTAKWTQKQKLTVEKLNFDMKSTKYYILLAYGPVKDGKPLQLALKVILINCLFF